MGKLHRSKRAFGKLPKEEREAVRGGVWFDPLDRIRFNIWTDSYKNYIKKLRREYLGEVAQCD